MAGEAEVFDAEGRDGRREGERVVFGREERGGGEVGFGGGGEES